MKAKTKKELLLEMENLQIRLDEAEETLSAIRRGEVDALVVSGPQGEKVYTLRGASQVYRVFVDSMSEGALSLTVEGDIFYCNLQFANAVGISMERLVGLPLKNLVAPVDQPIYERILEQGRATTAKGELSLITSEGVLLPVQLSISPLKMKGDGAVACAIVTDLTEHKQQEKILASEKLSRSILEQASEAIVVCDSEGKVIRASRAAQALCGENPLFKRFRDVFRLKFSFDIGEFTVSGPLRGEFVSAREVVLDRDNRSFHLLLNAGPLLSEEQEIVGCVVTLSDISQLKESEASLHRSEERYRGLFDNMTNGFALHEIILDENGRPCDYRFLEANGSFERLTGLKREEVSGRRVLEVLPELEPSWIEKYGHVALTGEPLRFVERSATLDRWYEVYSYRPAPAQFAAIFSDITERKKAEAEAEESKRTLEALMEFVPAGITIADAPGGRIRMVSRYGREMLGRHEGLTAEEVADRLKVYDKSGTALMPSQDLPLLRAIQHGETLENQEIMQRNVKGDLLSLLCSAAPLRDRAGGILGGIVTWHNITEMKKTRDALLKSEARFRELAESMPNLVWTCTAEGDCDFLSRQWLEYTGVSEAENLGFGWLNQVHPEDRDRLMFTWQKAVETGEIFDIEFRIRRNDGAWRWFKTRAVPARDENGRITKWYGSNTDIEDLKRGERALLDSEARFKLLSETASQLLRVSDPQGIINNLCRQVMEHLHCQVFFNFLADREAGRLRLNAFAGIPEEEAKKIEWLDYGAAVCGCVARDGERIVAEDIFNTPDIRTELVKAYGIQAYACHPLMAQERLIGTLSFGTKTRTRFFPEELALMKTVADEVAVAMERMGLLEALRRSRDEMEIRVLERTAELEERNRELQDFAFVASHDLREPLRKILTFGDMLANKSTPSLGSEGRDYIQRMQRAAARMQKLLESLLSYSRVSTKAEPFRETNLRESVQEALSDLEIPIKEKGASVKVDALPTVEADKSQMIQLFQNLIGNALKFQKENEHPRVNIYCRKGRNSKAHEICVEDNGIGFDEKYLDKIFMPFQRLHGRSDYEGVGMGLAICKKIVERHAGEITARSESGKGSVFIVTLPAGQKKG